ncbi:unnamed protein product [Pleuronectes platessa]|uniref:Uncharacterized protein n=1 Tax=Pleuronectes platessa TaxID=8262 RepID=A0A9N7VDG4_PLEPL|nr:unnamed protein product [Pleuronectes platessa]
MPSGTRKTASDRVSKPHRRQRRRQRGGGGQGGDERSGRRKEHISLLLRVSLTLAAAHYWSTATPNHHFITITITITIIISVCGGLTLAASRRGRTKQHPHAPMQAHCLAFPLARPAY